MRDRRDRVRAPKDPVVFAALNGYEPAGCLVLCLIVQPLIFAQALLKPQASGCPGSAFVKFLWRFQ